MFTTIQANVSAAEPYQPSPRTSTPAEDDYPRPRRSSRGQQVDSNEVQEDNENGVAGQYSK